MRRRLMVNVLRPETFQSFQTQSLAMSAGYPVPLLTRRALALRACELTVERRNAPQSVPLGMPNTFRLSQG